MGDAARAVAEQMRATRGATFTDEARGALAALLARRDSLPTLPPTSRLPCPLAAHGAAEGCDLADRPTHDTCSRCFTWAGCDDPDCDHPACGSRGWGAFRDAWRAAGESTDDLRLWEQPWRPWIEHGRHAVLLDEQPRGAQPGEKIEKTTARLLAALERGAVVAVTFGEHYLDAELALAARGIPMEARDFCRTGLDHLAYDVARGATELPSGGLVTEELRLAAALDLAAAPDGYQGALFS